MKTKLIQNFGALALALALFQSASPVRADDSTANDRIFPGKIAAVNVQNRTFEVHGWLGALTSRTFHVADDAVITLGLSRNAALTDLKPGTEVSVRYKKADGVNVAERVTQRLHDFTGFVRSVSPATREMVVEKGRIARRFQLPDDCRIAIHDTSNATLTELKPGERINVRYVWDGETEVAALVKDPSDTMNGTVTAVDMTTGTFKISHMLTDKKFNLGRDCRIVAGKTTHGSLRDLRLGEDVTVDYKNLDGVLIANRVEAEKAAATTQGHVAATKK